MMITLYVIINLIYSVVEIVCYSDFQDLIITSSYLDSIEEKGLRIWHILFAIAFLPSFALFFLNKIALKFILKPFLKIILKFLNLRVNFNSKSKRL